MIFTATFDLRPCQVKDYILYMATHSGHHQHKDYSHLVVILSISSFLTNQQVL